MPQLLQPSSAADYWARLQSYPRVGLTVAPRLHEWRARFPSRIVTLVSEAPLQLSLPLPPSPRHPVETRLYDPRQIDFYRFDIQRRCLIGAIEPLPASVPRDQLWFSTEHLVPKSSDLPFRTVFNGHLISQYLFAPPTRLNNIVWYFQQLPRSSWIYRYDLKDAFYALILHERDRRLTCFMFEGVIYWYRGHPQGISPSAPHLCEVTSAMAEYWSHFKIGQQPIQIGAYFDDLNGFASQRSTAILHSEFVRKEISALGLHLSSKSQPEPSQVSLVLGYEINTVNLTARLPAAKLQRLVQQAQSFLHVGRVTARELLSLAGRLMDARHASSLFRATAYALYPLLSLAVEWDSLVELSSECKDCLLFLQENAVQLNGRLFRYDNSTAIQLATDSSSTGWSAVITTGPSAGLSCRGDWTPQVIRRFQPSSEHINYLELLAVFLGIKQLLPRLANQTIWLQLDSAVALAYILKTGGPVSYLRAITWQTLVLCKRYNIYLTPPRLVPSRFNPADYATRHRDYDSVRISRHTLERLSLQWGPFSIDLFASCTNAICPRYFASQPLRGEAPDEGAEALDALAQPWLNLSRAWIFPPVHLIEQSLRKIILERPVGVLILPHLPSALWWPLYQQLSGDTQLLRPTDFKVDASHTSSIFLALSNQFVALRIHWRR